MQKKWRIAELVCMYAAVGAIAALVLLVLSGIEPDMTLLATLGGIAGIGVVLLAVVRIAGNIIMPQITVAAELVEHSISKSAASEMDPDRHFYTFRTDHGEELVFMEHAHMMDVGQRVKLTYKGQRLLWFRFIGEEAAEETVTGDCP